MTVAQKVMQITIRVSFGAQASGADPATSMGPYYPRAAYCDVSVPASRGCQACYG